MASMTACWPCKSGWRVPRLASDVDVKVMIQREEAEMLLASLKDDYVQLLPTDPRVQIKQSGLLFLRDSLGHRIDHQASP